MSDKSEKTELQDLEELLEQSLAAQLKKPELLQELADGVNFYIERLKDLPQMPFLNADRSKSDKDKIQYLLLLSSLSYLIGLFRKTRTELEQANSSYEEVLGLLTHEFRNLLSTLDGYQRIVEHHLDVAGEQEMLEVQRAGSHIVGKLFNFLESILKFYQSDRKLLKPECKLTDFEEDILIPLEREFENELKNRKIEIKRSSTGEHRMVNIDPQLIEIAIRNLIDNAIKYGQPGSNIEIFHEYSNDTMVIRVKSYNQAIPADLCQNIFDRFRTKKIGNVKTGTGIGLYNVRNIVNIHQGEIHCHSKAGKWVEFVISIPVRNF